MKHVWLVPQTNRLLQESSTTTTISDNGGWPTLENRVMRISSQLGWHVIPSRLANLPQGNMPLIRTTATTQLHLEQQKSELHRRTATGIKPYEIETPIFIYFLSLCRCHPHAMACLKSCHTWHCRDVATRPRSGCRPASHPNWLSTTLQPPMVTTSTWFFDAPQVIRSIITPYCFNYLQYVYDCFPHWVPTSVLTSHKSWTSHSSAKSMSRD